MTTEPKEHIILGVTVVCLSYSLEVNDHLLYYQTPEECYSEDDLTDVDTSKDIYSLRIYKHTPTGFEHIIANSLEELVEELHSGQ